MMQNQIGSGISSSTTDESGSTASGWSCWWGTAFSLTARGWLQLLVAWSENLPGVYSEILQGNLSPLLLISFV